MSILTDCTFVDILAILITICIGVITYYEWAQKYWERKKVPFIKPSFPFGTMSNPLSPPESFGEEAQNQYNELKSQGHKHGGLFAFTVPIYMPVDPEYVKNIMSRDFNHFVDRGVYYNEKDDPISAHLFSLEGAKWKNLRMKLTPTFTSGKMKMMFQTLIECGNQLKSAMNDLCSRNEPVNIKHVLGCFTTDVIGSCAFGLDCNSFKDPNTEFLKYSKRVFRATKYESLKGLIAFSMPSVARALGMTLTPKDAADFFMNVNKNTVEYREKNNYVRKDFMQLLVDLKNKKVEAEDFGSHLQDEKGLTMEELAAQAFVFFLAGFETSSTTMNFCLFELALNQELQEKVRREVNEVLDAHDGKLTYDGTMEMKYMGQVIDETLRKYPPLPVLNRKCIEDYIIPGTNITIEKGTNVIIPTLGLQRDEEYFPEPEKFDPERFSDKRKTKINPFTYMPFGEGPRICIGLRFGVLQTKVGLSIMLKNYRFALNSKTQTPLKLDPYNFLMSPVEDIWLDVTKIE